jgi:hypothetical protein
MRLLKQIWEAIEDEPIVVIIYMLLMVGAIRLLQSMFL